VRIRSISARSWSRFGMGGRSLRSAPNRTNIEQRVIRWVWCSPPGHPTPIQV
jgi:hypothetical protein